MILTGTPEGVGRMQPGQEVSVEIEGIGTLTNTVTSDSAPGTTTSSTETEEAP